MQLIMRRLHPRGVANRGICVDAEGAMLGPDCVLVRRSSRGFHGIEREHAAALQKCALLGGRERDLLFHQSQRIAEALNKGEIALAQIYGLHIPVVDLDDRQLARISHISFDKGYDPDEPRVPKGDPHAGEWTTGGASDAGTGSNVDVAADSSDGGDDGSGGSTAGEGPSGAIDAMAASADQGNGDDTPPANGPPMEFKWPDASPQPGAPPPQAPNPDSGPGTLGSPDLGDGATNAAPQPIDTQPSSPDSAAAPSASDTGGAPPPDVPATQPTTTPEINAVLRSLATWLGRALAVLGALYEFDPEVAAVLAAIEVTSWLADYSAKIFTYLDRPQTLADLQNAVTRPAAPGYEIHHIVEVLRGSSPQSNADRFPTLIESRENLVRVPYWKHVEISAWYSRKNAALGDITPRDYLRGKTWNEQYSLGLDALRLFGVLK